MESTDKALELVNKFAIYLRANLMYDEDADEDAKQCALIAVDEIIKELKNFGLKYSVEWWEEVKKEIEKLWSKIPTLEHNIALSGGEIQQLNNCDKLGSKKVPNSEVVTNCNGFSSNTTDIKENINL